MTQSSRGIENPTARVPFAKMWIRISVLVAFPPVPASIAWRLPACRYLRTDHGKMSPFQYVRLSRPMSRMFCGPVDGPLTIACELPMLRRSLTPR